MGRSDIPDDSAALKALKEGHKDEAQRRIAEDIMSIEHGAGSPQQKYDRELAYFHKLQQDMANDRELTKLGFPPLVDSWQDDGRGHRTAKLVSDTNHNRKVDSGDLQVDITDTVLGDRIWQRPLKDRTAHGSDGHGQFKPLTPQLDQAGGRQPELKADTPKMAPLEGKVDTSGETQPGNRVFKLGAQEQEFHASATLEMLPGGRVVDWTKWHHDFVLSAKREFEQLLASSPELRADAGSYAPTGNITLQLDVFRDGQIEVRGIKGMSFYGADGQAQERFKQITRDTFARLEESPALRFPPGSQREVNSVEIQVGLNTGNSARWQKNDREKIRGY
jgi:hypothetical protein